MGGDEDVGPGGFEWTWSPLRVAAKDKELESEEVEDDSVEETELSSSVKEVEEVGRSLYLVMKSVAWREGTKECPVVGL